MLSTLLVFRFMLKSVEFILVLSVFFTLFIWARCTFPRIRYDCLMLYLWKSILPSLIYLFLIIYLALILIYSLIPNIILV
jgi:NADH:ubiquinone oxidoreductase subunit H